MAITVPAAITPDLARQELERGAIEMAVAGSTPKFSYEEVRVLRQIAWGVPRIEIMDVEWV